MDSFIELFKQKVSNNKKMTLKQQQILKVSIDLFSQKGFANTSTNEIAKQANVAEGTIFKHFGNKEIFVVRNGYSFNDDRRFT
ncbi:helix-turn-helix transcriptional regulator [Carnobacterium sp. CS13]|nr:helix-turn-helix transcriptional regulator [Carnobacterium sp. CS13]